MHGADIDLAETGLSGGLAASLLSTGHVVGITREGKALVDYAGNSGGPLEARSVIAVDLPETAEGTEPCPVLLFFEHQDPQHPVILGVLRDTVRPPKPADAATLTLARPGRDVLVDGKAVQLEAAEEIVLRCGKSSLTLRRDGKIVLKGTEIISRASETNKIKGGLVKIN